MSVEFIGYVGNNNSSETIVRNGPIIDRYHIEAVAKAHENAGFDRALEPELKILFDKLEVMLDMAQLAFESDSTRIVTLMVDAFATPAFRLHHVSRIRDG